MKSLTGTDIALTDAGSPASVERAALEERFDSLMTANGPALTRLAATYTNSPSDRDDLLQEIAVAVWQALRGFRGECSERTFLFRIAHNRAVSFLARSRAQISSAGEEIELHDPAPDPESGLAREQSAGRLRHAIRMLPVVYRQVIILTLEDLDYREIAEILGISESNVGARLSRARRMLRESLENWK